jgi:hypothetical protein
MHDALGREIIVFHDGKVPSGQLNLTKDISDLAAGTYFLHINFNGKLKTEKMVIH